MTFRKDINGLRAIAVLAVIFFHFKVAGFSGGFIGVDVFFVISGFLMTGIIFSKIQNNEFSIISFYLRRARRIIPALACLCISLFIFGFFFLLVDDYRALQKDIVSSMLFTSNIYYYKHSGYFDVATQENWLLHTWSLSVEWQFYIIYPIVIALLHKLFSKEVIKLILIIIAITCFSLSCTYYAHYNPTAGFYLLPSRAWQMIAGGVVFLFPLSINIKQRGFLVLLGIGLVLSSIFYFDSSFIWPYYYSIIPVIGAMLILYGNKDSFITSNPISQFVGKISYSAYLWHWPIVVFLYLTGKIENIIYISVGIVISIFLATLSYYIIETRRLPIKNNIVEFVKYLFLVFIIVFFANKANHYIKKYSISRPQILADIFIESSKRNPLHNKCLVGENRDLNEAKECVTTDDKVSIIVAGDSFADAMFTGVALTNKTGATMQLSSPGCAIIENLTFKKQYNRDYCLPFVSKVLNILDKNYHDVPVVLISRLAVRLDETYFSGVKSRHDFLDKFKTSYINTICRISKNRPVFIVKPPPLMPTNVPKAMALGYNPKISLATYIDRNKLINSMLDSARDQCGAVILDVTDYFCDSNYCYGVKNNKPLYFDDNHLSEYGNKLLIPLFEEITK